MNYLEISKIFNKMIDNKRIGLIDLNVSIIKEAIDKRD